MNHLQHPPYKVGVYYPHQKRPLLSHLKPLKMDLLDLFSKLSQLLKGQYLTSVFWHSLLSEVHWLVLCSASSIVKGVHTGQMVLRLVEAIDVYLAGTVMFIFGMGLYGLFIANASPSAHPTADCALKQSSLFGMFVLKERPKWMKISSLDELKTKVGHVIVMILLVKMFERSKMVPIATGTDLLSYSVCIFLSSASLYILHNLHKSE
ncbi:hypothetical protein HAX54_009281 [Datura stramonium]|uniref:Uncharacterized protein n=1 Tax=Datura stramonium TaxID=4076 RepID=A0ABS8TFE8_DATST|nr:hypothetical protein [Datura stramonium]